jgi:large subunit ribosomal protein L2
MPLVNIPLNLKIHCIEAYPGSGAVYIRAGGNWAIIVAKNAYTVQVLFRNGLKKAFSPYCLGVLGRVSNIHKQKKIFKKAGDARNFGIRPSVRGVAMNPVDHPHGGGKGKKSKNTVPEAPWGRLGPRKKK